MSDDSPPDARVRQRAGEPGWKSIPARSFLLLRVIRGTPCATHTFEGGADIRSMQLVLGHEKIKTAAMDPQSPSARCGKCVAHNG